MPTVDNHDFPYYLKCLIGGAITCGSTHTLMTPLDVMKCKEQIEPQYSKGFVKGIKKLRNNGHIFLGWTPTLVGYSLQGLGKFGFY